MHHSSDHWNVSSLKGLLCSGTGRSLGARAGGSCWVPMGGAHSEAGLLCQADASLGGDELILAGAAPDS